jgi:MoxR-like ATPase
MFDGHTMTLPWVEQATRHFVYVEDMREAFSLALVAGQNLIFSGPGGHGKSEFLTAAFDAIEDVEAYVKSFGQGTSPEELYGGLDLDALNQTKGATMKYNTTLSFLSHRIAIFEELFDAPPRVLTSLKDTLTARELRNGSQRIAMKTRMIAAATNHDPDEIARGGPEIAALVERFSVQMEVKWSEYNEDSFMELLDVLTSSEEVERQTVTWESIERLQEQASKVSIDAFMKRLIARLVAALREEGVRLSPRTIERGLRLVRAAATINGRTEAVPEDLQAMVFLPGVYAMTPPEEATAKLYLATKIEELETFLKSERRLDQLEAELMREGLDRRNTYAGEDRDLLSTAQYEAILEEIYRIQREATNLTLPMELSERRKAITKKANALVSLNESELGKRRIIDRTIENREKHRKRLNEIEEEIKDSESEEYLSRGYFSWDRPRSLYKFRDRLTEVVNMDVHPDLADRRRTVLEKLNNRTYGRW